MSSFSQVLSKAFFMRSPKAARKASRQVRKTSKHDYQKLEDRNLLAAFSGTLGEDVIVIHYEGDRPASIEINGETFENSDATLELDLSDVRSRDQSLNNDQLTLSGGDGHDVRFGDIPSAMIINETTFVSVRDRNNLTSLQLRTGDGEDTVHTNLIQSIRYFTEGGDDVVYFDSSLTIDLGSGDDRLIETRPDMSRSGSMNGGEGYDVVESSSSYSIRGDRVTQHGHIPGIYGGTTTTRSLYGFEEFTGTIESPTSIVTTADTLVIGSTAWVYATGLQDNPLRFENADTFSGLPNERTPSIYVHKTAYPISIGQDAYVNLGGDFGNGDTSGIKHEVTLRFTKVAIISNSGSIDPQNVEITPSLDDESNYEIVGLTPKKIILEASNNNSHINLAGSNTANDIFSVSDINFHLVLFGNGGDDQFRMVNGLHAAANSVVNTIGGEGDDYLEIDDRNSLYSHEYYGLNENWIFAPRQYFHLTLMSALSHYEMERTHIIADNNTGEFHITPSSQTQYTITGKLNREFAEVFNLQQPYQGTFSFIDLGESRYSWYFGEHGSKFVYFRYHTPDV